MGCLRKFLPFFLPFIAFLIYLLTAPASMLWLDSARFVSAIVTLGVSNPPEPLYVLIAHFFTFLPFGSYIFRIQIFSALTASVVLFILYKITFGLVYILNDSATQKEGKTKKNNSFYKRIIVLSAVFSVICLAFSYEFWSQAENIETFILICLLEVLVIYLILFYPHKLFLVVAEMVALIGLGTGTNPVIFSIVPAVLIMLWQNKILITGRMLAGWFLIGICSVILVNIYVPIRAITNPFLNWGRATSFKAFFDLISGAGLNVYIPELNRINGFTGSPIVFINSVWHYFQMLFLAFTPVVLLFMAIGAIFIWKKNKYYFYVLFSIVLSNLLFGSLYLSGNQESWFLLSDVVFAIFAGAGYCWLNMCLLEDILLKMGFEKRYARFGFLLIIASFAPLLFWFTSLNRSQGRITDDYIQNLYKPIGNKKAILFGSSDLFDAVSYYVHDVDDGNNYKPNVIPVTDNIFYMLRWYRENLNVATGLKMPDDSHLKYNSADEYSKFVNDFFALNIDKYDIYIDIPAIKNNFLPRADLYPSYRVDSRFKLIPEGMLFRVIRKNHNIEPNLSYFNYRFSNGFPKEKPVLLEKVYKSELMGVINEYADSFENLGDYYLSLGKVDNALASYRKAYFINPKNSEVLGRLGTYYGSMGDHQKAAEYFERALQIEPDNLGFMFNLAMAYKNTGNNNSAIKEFNAILGSARGSSNIAKLALQNIELLRNATPSSVMALPQQNSTNLGEKKVVNWRLYIDKSLNIEFLYPDNFSIVGGDNKLLLLTNNLGGSKGLNFIFYGRKIKNGEDINSLTKNLPFILPGVISKTQQLNLPGFQALGITYQDHDFTTLLLLMRKGSQGYAIKIYPGNSTEISDFTQILRSIKIIN